MVMKTQRGRPPKPPDQTKGKILQVRVEDAEREGFRAAAVLAGLDLSAWARERLRTAARKELTSAGREVAFLP
jgi:hypothetical protein